MRMSRIALALLVAAPFSSSYSSSWDSSHTDYRKFSGAFKTNNTKRCFSDKKVKKTRKSKK